MADGVSQFAAVEGVEVEVFDTFAREDFDHIDGDAGGNKVARALVVIQTFVHFRQPAWDFDVGHLGHFGQLFEIGYRQDAGNDFNIDAHHHATVAEAQIAFHVEEELGDNVVCTCIDFAFQIDQVGLSGFGFRVYLRIGCYGNVKVGNGAQQFDQILGIERFFLVAGRLVAT